MIERLVLQARRASSTRVAINMVLAVNVLRKGLSQCEFRYIWFAHQEQRMRNFVGVDHFAQAFYNILIANNVVKPHFLLSVNMF